VRAIPFTEEIVKFVDAHDRIYVVEQNRDGQLAMLLKLELSPDRCKKLRSVLHYSGLPIDARTVSDDILSQEGFEVAKRVTAVAGGSMIGGE
jgi:2-oxoglutarate ferredoxin oxidoreductase subunit alpha